MRGADEPGEKRVSERPIGKNPTISAVLSFVIPGVGQLYNGDTLKGVIVLVAVVLGAIATGGLLYIPIMIYAVVDAYQVAKGKWSPLRSGRPQWSGRS